MAGNIDPLGPGKGELPRMWIVDALHAARCAAMSSLQVEIPLCRDTREVVLAGASGCRLLSCLLAGTS